jgi:hypothetical protein
MRGMGRLLVALLLLGCNGLASRPLDGFRNDAGAPDGSGAQSAAGEAGLLLPDAPAPLDTLAALQADAAVMVPDVAAPLDLSSLPDLSLDLPPDLGAGRCPMGDSSDFTTCLSKVGELNFLRRRSGNLCGRCTVTPHPLGDPIPVSECMMGMLDYPLLCVSSCQECCHTERGAPCKAATDCCQPLHCIASTCQLPP